MSGSRPMFDPPRTHDRMVARPDLVARLDDAARGALTLIVAPAGWGKTVLAAQWARARERVAWVHVAPGADLDSVAHATLRASGADAPTSPAAPASSSAALLRRLPELLESLPECSF